MPTEQERPEPEMTMGEVLDRAGRRIASGLVIAGAVIGLMGTTYDREGGGYSTGVHLHFTLKRNGRPVDLLQYLP